MQSLGGSPFSRGLQISWGLRQAIVVSSEKPTVTFLAVPLNLIILLPLSQAWSPCLGSRQRRCTSISLFISNRSHQICFRMYFCASLCTKRNGCEWL